MIIHSNLEKTDLIPVAEATSLVPYSRDHITRLAREGKIVATQIARRWMVSAASLQRFYESCRHEDMVRQQYLSEARRRDLEIAEQLRRERSSIIATYKTTVPAFWYSTTVVLSGLFCGVLIYSSFSFLALPQNITSEVTKSETVMRTQIAGVGSALAVSSETGVVDRQPTSQSSELSLANGIVLLPLMASSTLRSEDFFSDDIDIEMTSETQGIIRLSGSLDASELKILRLPGSGEVVEVTTRAP